MSTSRSSRSAGEGGWEMNKLKTYRIYWTAEISGFDEVEALDEQDAEDQFDCLIQDDRIPQDKQFYASIDSIELRKK